MKRKFLCCLLSVMMISVLRAEAAVKIVFAGDGVTDGAWGRSRGVALAVDNRNSTDLNHHLGDSYVFLCAAWYQSQYPDEDIEVYNRGIYGNTLDDLADRWQNDVLSIMPDVISVLVGGDDVEKSISEGTASEFDYESWSEKYRTILQAARTANSAVKLVLCAPFAGRMASEYTQRKSMLAQCCEKVMALADEMNAIYVGFDELFEEEKIQGCMLWNGTHPTAAGNYNMYRMWVDKVGTSIFADNENIMLKELEPKAVKESKGRRRVLYIGDSITDSGWGLSGGSALQTSQRNLTDMGHILGHGYAMLCGAWLQSNYDTVEYEVLDRGISGNTLANLNTRWQQDVIDLNPDVLSVLIGTNDINEYLQDDQTGDFDYDAWETMYRNLLNMMKLKNPNVKLVLGAPFVGRKSKNYETRKNMVAECALRVKKIAGDMGATYIAFDELFENLADNQPNEAYWIWDGIHPTPAGHYKMFELWMDKAADLIFEEQGNKSKGATGAQFKDRILPMQGNKTLSQISAGMVTDDGEWLEKDGTLWGEDGVQARYVDNGLETSGISWWGGNIVKADDGKYHAYVAWWDAATRAHSYWPNSDIYHVVSDNLQGPYTRVENLGKGHNPNVFRAKDGSYVVYALINNSEAWRYRIATLDSSAGSTFERMPLDLRDRPIVTGTASGYSNFTFAERDDGSVFMMCRGGGSWVSEDGLKAFNQIHGETAYPNGVIGTLEDPVVWRDEFQYHMIVNDWRARIAYYNRSLDGVHWIYEIGTAYDTDVAVHADGTSEAWYKFERPRVFQDEHGRAIQLNMAVIDVEKGYDKAGDNHSSKNICMPLNPGLLLEVLNTEAISTATPEIRVMVKAEEGFVPGTDINISTLRFGTHAVVNGGGGAKVVSSTTDPEGNLILTFNGADTGIDSTEFAPKMLGYYALNYRNPKTPTAPLGGMCYGYARLPYLNYNPALLSSRLPLIGEGSMLTTTVVENFGLTASSGNEDIRIATPSGTLIARGTARALQPYGADTVSLEAIRPIPVGTEKLVVTILHADKELDRATLPLTEALAVQKKLSTAINEAQSLSENMSYRYGKDELNSAIDVARTHESSFYEPEISAAAESLAHAINLFKFANATKNNPVNINLANATMESLEGWTILHEGTGADFHVNSSNNHDYNLIGRNPFMEAYSGNGITRPNYAKQTFTDMPAGLYVFEADVIAQRGSAGCEGVSLFMNDKQTTCSAKTASYSEHYTVEVNLAETATLEFGIIISSSSNATWVGFDNAELKYYGDGSHDDDEPVRNVSCRNCYIKSANISKNCYLTVNTTTMALERQTGQPDENGMFTMVEDHDNDLTYIYNSATASFLYGSAGNGTAWPLASTTDAKLVEVEKTTNTTYPDAYVIKGDVTSTHSYNYMNAQGGQNRTTIVSYTAGDNNSQWYFVDAESQNYVFDVTEITEGLDSLLLAICDIEGATIIGGEASAIAPVVSEEKAATRSGVYDMAGKRLPSPHRGINIIDGKKVLIK